MEQQLAQLYKKLANQITSMIPIQWSEVYFLGEVEKDQLSWNSVFYFKESLSQTFIRSLDMTETFNFSEDEFQEKLFEIDDTLIELNDCFINNHQPVWEQVSFSLNNKGDFSIDYFYNTLSDSELGQPERETIWAYETFSYIPKEGSYTRTLLNDYLSNFQDK